MAPTDGATARRRERPWLIPSNRKLRHLHAVTLRNLSLAQPSRSQTTDDEALPTALKSPAKMLALMERRPVGHSRSSDNLRCIHESAVDDGAAPDAAPSNPHKTPTRPALAHRRRRSTLEWASASSLQRQKKLEHVTATRMADVFFSLHLPALKDPIYVSEVIERAINPNFNHIDLHACPPSITRSDLLTLKFWARTDGQPHYAILLDMTLSLASLQFIGKTLASFHHPFPPNCVLFHLTDGFYTAFTDARVDDPVNPFANLPVKEGLRPLPTSSFDALLRLSKLDDSVHDAIAARDRLAAHLDHVVHSHQAAFPHKSHADQAEDFVKTIQYATSTLEKQLNLLQQRRDEKRRTLHMRRHLLARELQSQKTVTANMHAEALDMQNMTHHLLSLRNSVAAQRRRISTDLTKIYPITPLPHRQLAFTIRGLHLPNSDDFDSAKNVTPDTVAAALGHSAHFIQLLSFYWSILLPYNPHPRSSTSSISDPISTLQSVSAASSSSSSSSSPFASAVAATSSTTEKALLRTFPLFSKAAVRFRFEYGLFLLNKDIQLLLEMAWGVRVLDIRQTLPNLLLAVHCATAGEGELPARKAGGVRALMRVAGQDRAEYETRDTEDSTALAVPSDAAAQVNGDLGAFESLKRVGRRRERWIDGAR